MSQIKDQLATALARAVEHETGKGMVLRKAGYKHMDPAWIPDAVQALAAYKVEQDEVRS